MKTTAKTERTNERTNATTVLFTFLYLLVTVATLRHSAEGFASLEGGSVIWGYLSALAVDAGMMLSALGLHKRRSLWLTLGLIVSMSASTFTQLLYSVSHASVLTVAPGAMWLGDVAQQIADVRVIVLPALLPALSIVYSFASKQRDVDAGPDVAEIQRQRDEARHAATRLQQERDNLLAAQPLLDALPMQARAKLFALSDGNGIKPGEVARELGISLAQARRGVAEARNETKNE